MTTSTVGRPSGGVDRDRDATAAVDHADTAVGEQRDLDAVAVAGEGLVDGVVDDLAHQVVQAAAAHRWSRCTCGGTTHASSPSSTCGSWRSYPPLPLFNVLDGVVLCSATAVVLLKLFTRDRRAPTELHRIGSLHDAGVPGTDAPDDLHSLPWWRGRDPLFPQVSRAASSRSAEHLSLAPGPPPTRFGPVLNRGPRGVQDGDLQHDALAGPPRTDPAWPAPVTASPTTSGWSPEP